MARRRKRKEDRESGEHERYGKIISSLDFKDNSYGDSNCNNSSDNSRDIDRGSNTGAVVNPSGYKQGQADTTKQESEKDHADME